MIFESDEIPEGMTLDQLIDAMAQQLDEALNSCSGLAADPEYWETIGRKSFRGQCLIRSLKLAYLRGMSSAVVVSMN